MSIESHELALSSISDGGFYQQHVTPTLTLLANKIANKTYNAKKAMIQWRRVADAAAQLYSRQYDAKGGPLYGVFTAKDRQDTAKEFAEHYDEELQALGNHPYKKAVAADAAFSRALVKKYGSKRAANKRYSYESHGPEIDALRDAKTTASEDNLRNMRKNPRFDHESHDVTMRVIRYDIMDGSVNDQFTILTYAMNRSSATFKGIESGNLAKIKAFLLAQGIKLAKGITIDGSGDFGDRIELIDNNGEPVGALTWE